MKMKFLLLSFCLASFLYERSNCATIELSKDWSKYNILLQLNFCNVSKHVLQAFMVSLPILQDELTGTCSLSLVVTISRCLANLMQIVQIVSHTN